MSWQNAVGEIIEQMLKDAEEIKEFSPRDVRGYARQLQTVLKAFPAQPQQQQLPAFIQHRNEIEKAKAEFRTQQWKPLLGTHKEMATTEEDFVGQMVNIEGGPNHGVCVKSVHTQADVGKMIIVGGAVYTVKPNLDLHYEEEETKKLQKQVKAN